MSTIVRRENVCLEKGGRFKSDYSNKNIYQVPAFNMLFSYFGLRFTNIYL